MNILLVCGGGASTGFLVQSMRKAAKKKGINAEINARSVTLLENFINEIDVLLVGPHMRFDEEGIKEITSAHNVPYAFIDQMVYSSLNGEAALEAALSLLNQSM